MKRKESNPKSSEEKVKFFGSSMSMLDAQRLAELEKFRDMQLIRNEVLVRERDRLEKKNGTTDLRVKRIESNLLFNKGMFTGLEVEIEKASIVQEPFQVTWWRVHGRVYDGANRKPATGLTVFLADSKMNWIESLGSVCTDEKGYYSLTLNEKMIKEAANQPLFVSVSDSNKKVIFYDSLNPLKATPGLIDFKDIYLGEKECTPPASRKHEK